LPTSTSAAVSPGMGGSLRPIGCCCAVGCRSSSATPARRRRSRSRGAPAGGSSSRSCSAPASGRIWPSRPTRRPRGPKRRAKTDRADARLLRNLLADGRLPESQIPPAQVLEMRARLQLFKDLREQHTGWVQRAHAILLHHGLPAVTGGLLGLDNRRRLEAGEAASSPRCNSGPGGVPVVGIQVHGRDQRRTRDPWPPSRTLRRPARILSRPVPPSMPSSRVSWSSSWSPWRCGTGDSVGATGPEARAEPGSCGAPGLSFQPEGRIALWR
jgi:hypothetical protein